MGRVQPTAVELLDTSHPGLRLDVDLWFDHHETHEAILAKLKEKYDVTLPLSTLSSYKMRRWLPALIRIRDLKEKSAAILQVVEQHGITPIARALILEHIDEVAPETLLREERERTKLEIEQGKLDVARQQAQTAQAELELKVRQLEAQQERTREAVEEAEQKLGKGESLTLADINRIRERVFGLPQVGEPQAPAGNPA